MTNEMRALVKAAPETGLGMETRPVPEIGLDDVLIRVNKTGICGTDIHIWHWDDWAAKTVPVPLDHRARVRRRDRRARPQRRQGSSLGQRCSGEGHLIGKTSRQSRARASSTSTQKPAALA
jgi:threonine 3-dehydrogenase